MTRPCDGLSWRKRKHCWAIGVALGLFLWAELGLTQDPFPRLIGMNIGKKHYDDPVYQRDLAKLDIVVLGFYRGWGSRPEAMRAVVQELKRLNPSIQVGQYSVMNELRDVAGDVALEDIRWKVGRFGWWLRNRDGKRVQWTSRHDAWEVNFTALAAPDADGKRYPQWLAERDYRAYHQGVPEFDFWYTDNVMSRPRVSADWDGDGRDDDPDDPRILKVWREGYVDWWSRIRQQTPGKWIMGNLDGALYETEFRSRLEAAFLEALIGEKWSIETRHGWQAMMDRYRAVKSRLREPRIVGFGVEGDPRDYRAFRYAFASCLLDDGYFSFSDRANGGSSVPWFDEYDVELGQSVSPPPRKPWQNDVWRRDFERGVVLLNPGVSSRDVELEPGLNRFRGLQAPDWNDGTPAGRLRLPPRDGLILVREKGL